MATHRIDAAPETVHWGFFDAALKPLLTVESGETVTISTVSGMASQMPPSPFVIPKALPAIHANSQQKLPGHMCTGPVAVKGAKQGQVLEVRIKDIQLHYEWGYNMIRPLSGALPDDFHTPTLIHIPLDRQKNTAKLPWGLELPLAPFFGVRAVAPPPARCGRRTAGLRLTGLRRHAIPLALSMQSSRADTGTNSLLRGRASRCRRRAVACRRAARR